MTKCVPWTGYIDKDGYGRDRGRMAHRVKYERRHVIPAGWTIDHLCRNRRCVNLRHLEAVPHRVNILRGEGIAGRNARKTECIRGHSLSGANLRVSRGHRSCRACAENRNGETMVKPNQTLAPKSFASRIKLVGAEGFEQANPSLDLA